jgi:hypothetical protein
MYWSAMQDRRHLFLTPMTYPMAAGAQIDPKCRVSSAHADPHPRVGEARGPSCLGRMASSMDQITIKTPNPECRLYWCLLDFIDRS